MQVNALFKAYSGNRPGASVMIIRNGKPILVKSYGLADVEKHVPVTPATNFRLASVTKQFTAASILRLIESGQLTLATTLRELFPDFPDYGKKITIDQLLHHTSGLLDYEDIIPDTVKKQLKDKDVLELMMQQDSTLFPPGTQYRYSNTGYAVLAMIIEKVSGQRYADFLREQIFAPLKMTGTVAYEKGISTVPHRAFGYTVKGDSILFTDQSTYSAVLGDGGIYSSVNDLFKWDQALYGNRVLSFLMQKYAFTPQLEHYGCGWRIDRYKGHLRIHHTGSTSGFRNVIQRFPDDHFTVIILTNRSAPGVAPLAEKLVDLYLLK
jgi:CubicO group peptidase (beta-lactamase class C family)